MHPKMYIAGPLFSDAEKAFNTKLRELLDEHFDVFLPQESGFLLREMVASGQGVAESTQTIFDKDVAAIRASDYFLLILDGRAVDEGAAFELGVAFSAKKRCYGLQTDWRQLLPIGQNPMLIGALTQVFYSVNDLKAWAIKGARE